MRRLHFFLLLIFLGILLLVFDLARSSCQPCGGNGSGSRAPPRHWPPEEDADGGGGGTGTQRQDNVSGLFSAMFNEDTRWSNYQANRIYDDQLFPGLGIPG